MRFFLVLLMVATVSPAARAEGPEEPRRDAPPAAAPTPAQPAAAQPAPAQPAPEAAVAPTAGDKDVTVTRPSKKWGWAFGGAAVGCLLVGSILGGVAYGRSGEQEGNPASPMPYTEGLQQRGSEGQAIAGAGYAFLGVGAALAIVDAVIWYEILRKPQVKKVAAARFSAAGVRF
jgi:hypothetical protein